jgi:hypothetical protein
MDTTTVTLNGGTFLMGSTKDCTDLDGTACAGDRVPHKVRVSAFAMDDTEVTQRQYAACVTAGMCAAAGANYGANDDTPVTVDDPELARKYCAARKTPMRLPTEAEFEFASRVLPDGTEVDFAWGDASPSCARVPYAGCAEQRPRVVGTTPGDASPSGVHDLAGNVPEWVEDNYSPYIGCADHLSYGELCWGKSNGCADMRCSSDGPLCAHGCLPQAASGNPTGGDAGAPVCGVPPDAALVIDPVARGGSPFGVIRGGGPTDSACAFAAFTRRHAAPKSFVAGFRCVLGGDKLPRRTQQTYRFAINGCPPNGRVRMVVDVGGGNTPAVYSLDYFATGASTPISVTAMSGLVEDLPCDAVFVLYPQQTDSITLKINTVGNPMCLGISRLISLALGDTPPNGIDSVPLASSMSCM